MTRYARLASPLGPLLAIAEGEALVALDFTDAKYARPPEPSWIEDPAWPVLRACAAQLAEYFAGERGRFDLPLAPRGTPFQRRVWDAILAIPAGESRTYGELARKLVTAARAVGQACGANPIALIIPCHRVVGSLGALGGFMGTSGTFAPSSADDLFAKAPSPLPATPADPRFPAAIKRWLLSHEGYRFGR